MANNNNENSKSKKRTRVSQSDFPQLSLEKALRIAQAIWEQYAGKPTAPHDIAFAIDLVPTSGGWRNLCGTSVAYGLTEGGYGVKYIKLTDLGQRIVAPTEPGEDIQAKREALLKPRIMREFYEKYNRAKFPEKNIAKNVLVSLGLPKGRADTAVEILIDNGLATSILRETSSGGYFVALDLAYSSSDDSEMNDQDNLSGRIADVSMPQADVGSSAQHGKNSKLSFSPKIHVNLEIHIAADTPEKTVESIFKNIKKYLLDDE